MRAARTATRLGHVGQALWEDRHRAGLRHVRKGVAAAGGARGGAGARAEVLPAHQLDGAAHLLRLDLMPHRAHRRGAPLRRDVGGGRGHARRGGLGVSGYSRPRGLSRAASAAKVCGLPAYASHSRNESPSGCSAPTRRPKEQCSRAKWAPACSSGRSAPACPRRCPCSPPARPRPRWASRRSPTCRPCSAPPPAQRCARRGRWRSRTKGRRPRTPRRPWPASCSGGALSSKAAAGQGTALACPRESRAHGPLELSSMPLTCRK